MENFNFYNRTKILFGESTEMEVAKEIHSLGCKKVMIHFGSDRIKRNGLLDKITAQLNEIKIDFVELGGVVPNPRLSKVYEGIELARKEGVDFILAIGGGSVIDSAKAIAIGVKYEGDVWDFFEGVAEPEDAVKVGTVLTIPAAGSEASSSAVITNEEKGRKVGFFNPILQPIFSVMNPEMTMSLPDYQTACGASDMLAHVMERFFVNVDNTDVTDALCLAHMKSIMKNARLVLKNPQDYDLRAEMMLAGFIAHNGWLSVGRTNGDWASHKIEHELSLEYDIAHGAGLSIIFPSWMRYVYKDNMKRFEMFAKEVFGLSEGGEESILKAISMLEDFYKEIGLPTKMSDAGIENPDIERMARNAVNNSTIGNLKVLNEKDVEEIYKLSF